MFDKNALNDEWIRAAEAWKECKVYDDMLGMEYAFRECGHNGLRRKKDGGRDRRYPCQTCLTESEKACDKSNAYGILFGNSSSESV
jgi:hypothetical protein